MAQAATVAAIMADIEGRLKIGKSLGSGGFAIVYRATLDGRNIALKVLLPQHSNMPTTGRPDCPIQMFLREGRCLQENTHNNLITCLEVMQLPPNFLGLTKGYICPTWALALELMEEGSLSNLMQRQLLTPWNQLYSNEAALFWCLDAAQALAHLHACSPPVFHRDIKLENVMLSKPGSNGRSTAKLGDLGLHTCPDIAHCRQQRLLRAPLVRPPSGTKHPTPGASHPVTPRSPARPGAVPEEKSLHGPTPLAAASAGNASRFAAAPVDRAGGAGDSISRHHHVFFGLRVGSFTARPINMDGQKFNINTPYDFLYPSTPMARAPAGGGTPAAVAGGAAAAAAAAAAADAPGLALSTSPLWANGALEAAAAAACRTDDALARASAGGATASVKASGLPGRPRVHPLQLSAGGSAISRSDTCGTADTQRTSSACTTTTAKTVEGVAAAPSATLSELQGHGPSPFALPATTSDTMLAPPSMDACAAVPGVGGGSAVSWGATPDGLQATPSGRLAPLEGYPYSLTPSSQHGRIGGQQLQVSAPGSAAVPGPSHLGRVAADMEASQHQQQLQQQGLMGAPVSMPFTAATRDDVCGASCPSLLDGRPISPPRPEPSYCNALSGMLPMTHGSSPRAASPGPDASSSPSASFRPYTATGYGSASTSASAHPMLATTLAAVAEASGASSASSVSAADLELAPAARAGGRSRPTTARDVRLLPVAAAGVRPEEMVEVWRFTGATGSSMYMPPEVFLHQPYNDRADVFSFAVLMYEVFARTLLSVSHIGTKRQDLPRIVFNCDDYAELVCEGYRPARLQVVPQAVWDLISDCWQHDPLRRPSMAEVVGRLHMLAQDVEAGNVDVIGGAGAKRSKRSGTSSAAASTAGTTPRAREGDAPFSTLPQAPACACTIC